MNLSNKNPETSTTKVLKLMFFHFSFVPNLKTGIGNKSDVMHCIIREQLNTGKSTTPPTIIVLFGLLLFIIAEVLWSWEYNFSVTRSQAGYPKLV